MDFQRGCQSSPELIAFQQQLKRNVSRFAFPDDFVANIQDFKRLIQNKHDKENAGRVMRMLREIRILADPGWEEPEEITFYFILDDEAERDRSMDEEIQNYMAKVKKEPPYDQVFPLIVYLEDMRADEYLASNRLDFDYLTQRSSHG